MTATVLLLAFIGCAGGPASRGEQAPDSSTESLQAVTLIAEKVISGKILGVEIRQPAGLAVDFRGIVFVIDGGNNRIIRFTPDLVASVDAGSYGADEGSLDRPAFITVDNGLNLVVSDVGNQRLSRFDGQLHYVDEIKLIDEEDPLKYGQPSGVALTEYGELWCADWEQNRLIVFDNIGRFESFVGDFGYTGGQLSQPEKLITNKSKDRFVVCDAGNRRLVLYDGYGNFEDKIEDDAFEYPIAATYDSGNRLWVLDGVTGEVLLIDRSGKRLLKVGPTIPGSDRALRNPSDIAVLSDGRLLISDTGNNRLVVCRAFYEE